MGVREGHMGGVWWEGMRGGPCGMGVREGHMGGVWWEGHEGRSI